MSSRDKFRIGVKKFKGFSRRQEAGKMKVNDSWKVWKREEKMNIKIHDEETSQRT